MKLQVIMESLRKRPILIVAVLIAALIGISFTTRYVSIQQQKASSLSGDQIIGILKDSELADPYDRLVKDESLVSLELATLSPTLRDYVTTLGHYDRLYASQTRMKSSKLYWIAHFLTGNVYRNFAGHYILDALTGEIMLIHERGPIPGPIPLDVSFEPSDPSLRRGENTSVILTLSGKPDYDVPWPPSLEMNEVESGLIVSGLNEVDRWDTDKQIVFSFTISVDPEVKTVTSGVRFDCELVGTRIGFGYSVWIEQGP